MPIYLIGVDIGTTGTKVGIFDLNGNIISNSYKEYKCAFPRPNWVEQDPEDLKKITFSLIKETIDKSNVKPKEILSISLSSQRSCAIFIDKNNKILRPMISWQDNRCLEEVKEIESKISSLEYYNITGFPNDTTWLLPKILWVRKNEPRVWDKTYKVIQLQDYFLKILGAEEYYNDVSDSGFYGLWETDKLKWSDKLLKIFCIDKDILPIPISSCSKVGTINKFISKETGLKEGTFICVGAGDQNSAAVGAGIVEEGQASVSIGTAGNANTFSKKAFRDPKGKIMSLNHAIYGSWEVEGHQASAGSVFRWYRDEFAALESAFADQAKKDVYKILDEISSNAPVGAKGLVFLPFLAGSASPRWNPNAKGVLFGLTFVHDKSCVSRAVIEGITMEMKDIIVSMCSSGIKIEKIRITGGATKSNFWNQIQSDVYGKPVETLKVSECAMLGASIMAGVGAGIFDDIKEGVENMVKIDKKYLPSQKNNKIYDNIYSIYCDIYNSINNTNIFDNISMLQSEL